MSLARRLWFGGGSVTFPGGSYTVTGPYDPEATVGATVLTQVHCHTNQSDGSYTPAAVVAYYLDRGYQALMLTDHDKVTTQPDGITTKLSGNELSPTEHHIIAIDSNYTRGSTTDAQTIVNGINATGGKASIAHPVWLRGMTYAEMASLTGYIGFEIHNGHCIDGAGQNPVTYPGYAISRWDDLLRNVRRNVWGLSVDDMHTIGAYDAYDMGRLQVFVPSNTASNVAAAIAAGDFASDVANFAVTPGYPDRSPSDLSLSCTGATRIEAWGADGLLSATNGSSHTHTFDGSEQYVRLVAIGDYTEPFDSLSDRWRALDGTWAVAGGVLALSSTDTVRRIILRRHRQGDFTAVVDMRPQGGGIDQAAFMFNVLNSSYYYMLRIGESGTSAYHHTFTLANTTSGSFGTPIASTAFTITPGTWYRMRMTYSAGRVRAKVWERSGSEPGDWMLDATSTAWTHGAFGFRASRTAEFDNLSIDGFQTFYQPIAVD